jgi:dCMP deaminase
MAEERPSWDQYFMSITEVISQRATCVKRKVGAIIVKENQILSTGYNGAPKGLAHCEKVGCMRKDLNIPSGERHELCRGLHAEQNAIIQAAWHGVKIEGGTMYCTYQPCLICVKMMLNAGIKELIYRGLYPDKLAADMLKESKMKVRKIE